MPEGRLLLMRLLQPLGFEVHEAADGEQAIEAWRQWRPAVILMDMRMPVLDGREATRQIKADAQGKDVIVIALTASSFEEQRGDILAAGCDDFIRKPFKEDTVLLAIARHLGIEYRYENSTEDPVPSSPEILTRRIAVLPNALREQLRDALVELDVQAVERALQDVRELDAGCADALQSLAKRFEYTRMQALFA